MSTLYLDQIIQNELFVCTHTAGAPHPAPYTALERAVSIYNVRIYPFKIDGFSLTIMMAFQFYLKI